MLIEIKMVYKPRCTVGKGEPACQETLLQLPQQVAVAVARCHRDSDDDDDDDDGCGCLGDCDGGDNVGFPRIMMTMMMIMAVSSTRPLFLAVQLNLS